MSFRDAFGKVKGAIVSYLVPRDICNVNKVYGFLDSVERRIPYLTKHISLESGNRIADVVEEVEINTRLLRAMSHSCEDEHCHCQHKERVTDVLQRYNSLYNSIDEFTSPQNEHP